MTSEWMRVMLDEIARKQAECVEERLELERRRGDVPREDVAPAGTGTPGASRAPGASSSG